MKTRLVLDVSTEQALVVERALDVYGRLGHGQLKIVAEVLQDLLGLDRDEVENTKKILASLAAALSIPPQGYGISHPDLEEDVRVAYDVQKVLQKSLAESTKMSPSTWYDGPLRRPKGQATSTYYEI